MIIVEISYFKKKIYWGIEANLIAAYRISCTFFQYHHRHHRCLVRVIVAFSIYTKFRRRAHFVGPCKLKGARLSISTQIAIEISFLLNQCYTKLYHI